MLLSSGRKHDHYNRLCILTVHVDVYSGLQRVRSIIVRSVALQLGVQVLATEIPHCNLVTYKMTAYASLENSGDITRHLLIPIPRDHRVGFSYDTRNKKINAIFVIFTAMLLRIQGLLDVTLCRWVREAPYRPTQCHIPETIVPLSQRFPPSSRMLLVTATLCIPHLQKMSVRVLCALKD